jgi:ketosteroid isomerase-like protein
MPVYRMTVRSKVLAIFDQANTGNWQAMIGGLADQFTYRFIGDTPLGGQRSTKAAMALWWQRLYRLFPGAQFHPQKIIVEGMPWNTTVMTFVKIKGSVPSKTANGFEAKPYENEFMQVMTLRWGKITAVTTIEDTLRFANILPVMVAAGLADASLPPIED